MSRRIRCVGFVLACMTIATDIRPTSADGTPSVRVERDAQVTSFDECVRREGKILKSYPPRCISKDGREFVQESDAPKRVCKDLCGDGVCQEMVCMAVGCPCPESVATCPKDCR